MRFQPQGAPPFVLTGTPEEIIAVLQGLGISTGQLASPRNGPPRLEATGVDPSRSFPEVLLASKSSRLSDRFLLAAHWLASESGRDTFRTRDLTELLTVSGSGVGRNPTSTLKHLVRRGRLARKGEEWILTEAGRIAADALCNQSPLQLLRGGERRSG